MMAGTLTFSGSIFHSWNYCSYWFLRPETSRHFTPIQILQPVLPLSSHNRGSNVGRRMNYLAIDFLLSNMLNFPQVNSRQTLYVDCMRRRGKASRTEDLSLFPSLVPSKSSFSPLPATYGVGCRTFFCWEAGPSSFRLLQSIPVESRVQNIQSFVEILGIKSVCSASIIYMQSSLRSIRVCPTEISRLISKNFPACSM